MSKDKAMCQAPFSCKGRARGGQAEHRNDPIRHGHEAFMLPSPRYPALQTMPLPNDAIQSHITIPHLPTLMSLYSTKLLVTTPTTSTTPATPCGEPRSTCHVAVSAPGELYNSRRRAAAVAPRSTASNTCPDHGRWPAPHAPGISSCGSACDSSIPSSARECSCRETDEAPSTSAGRAADRATRRCAT